MKIRVRIRVWCFVMLLLMQGCAFDFTPAIPTMGAPPTVSQPFQGFGPTPTDTPEMIELKEAVDLLFDPFEEILPENRTYEGSIFEQMDMDIREAYANCGFTLKAIAASSEANPMTDGKFLTCLQDREFFDPVSGETKIAIQWLRQNMTSAGGNPAYNIFLKYAKVDTTNPMNFELNYLDALMSAHPRILERAKKKLLLILLEEYSGDPSQALEHLKQKYHEKEPLGVE
jgi:hypothetical protein